MVEVTGLDRPGLLYDLTATLSKLNLNIASAHVATFGERAVDVFYVTDLLGAQITAPSRQAAIKRALLPLFAERKSAKWRRRRARPAAFLKSRCAQFSDSGGGDSDGAAVEPTARKSLERHHELMQRSRDKTRTGILVRRSPTSYASDDDDTDASPKRRSAASR